MIDVHCHLTFPELYREIDKVIMDARNVLDGIVTTGFPIEVSEGGKNISLKDTETFPDAERALNLAEKYRGFIFITLGLHPYHTKILSDKHVESYIEFIRNNKNRIIGIGEIGLDYHWLKKKEEIDRSREIFIQMLGLANELNLPVVLHLRKAEKDGFRIVLDEDIRNAVFHSYSGNMTLAKQILEEGYYISLNTRFKTCKTAKKIARRFPLEKILTETDAPFLSPTGERINYPVNVKYVVEEIARLRNLSTEIVDITTTRNATEFFKIKTL